MASPDWNGLSKHWQFFMGSLSGNHSGFHDLGSPLATSDTTWTPQPGDTFDSWFNRTAQQHPGMANWLNQNKSKIQSEWSANSMDNFGGTQSGSGPSGSGASGTSVADAATAGGLANVQAAGDAQKAFMTEMMKPLDQNDPYVKAIVANASNAAVDQAASQGITGPLSIAASQQNTAAAVQQLQSQRLGLGLQAAGQLGQQGLGVGQLGVGASEFGQGLNAQIAYMNQLAAQGNTTAGLNFVGQTLKTVVPAATSAVQSGLGSSNGPGTGSNYYATPGSIQDQKAYGGGGGSLSTPGND